LPTLNIPYKQNDTICGPLTSFTYHVFKFHPWSTYQSFSKNSLRYNSLVLSFKTLCTIHFLLACAQSCTTITIISFRTFITPSFIHFYCEIIFHYMDMLHCIWWVFPLFWILQPML
jgi:hypothetical protein